jgi:hypothetical protein
MVFSLSTRKLLTIFTFLLLFHLMMPMATFAGEPGGKVDPEKEGVIGPNAGENVKNFYALHEGLFM